MVLIYSMPNKNYLFSKLPFRILMVGFPSDYLREEVRDNTAILKCADVPMCVSTETKAIYFHHFA